MKLDRSLNEKSAYDLRISAQGRMHNLYEQFKYRTHSSEEMDIFIRDTSMLMIELIDLKERMRIKESYTR